MQVKLKNLDWDSLMFVVKNFEPTKLSMAEIFQLEKIADEIERSLRSYLEERDKMVADGQKILEKRRAEIEESREQHPDIQQRNFSRPSPEVEEKILKANEEIEKEINAPLAKLGEKMLMLDFEPEVYGVLRSAFQKAVRFGENGYSNSAEGRMCFIRTARALNLEDKFTVVGNDT